MTQQDTARTYDDLPESDVSTVLQVPLLWGWERATDPPGGAVHRRPSGRHRADPRNSGKGGRAHRQPATRQQRLATLANWADHPMAHTARVGLVSACLVLALFAAVLLALALWLP